MVINMNGTIRYTIRPYDTIWMLAQVFNTTVDSIMELNPGINPRNLLIGQVITIRPGYQYYPSYPRNGTGPMGEFMDDYMDEELDDAMDDMYDMDGMDGDMEELMNLFRMLWEQHSHWTAMAIISIIHDLPEREMVIQRLLRNATDFANAFSQYYGVDSAQALGDLMTRHLTIAAEVVEAAKTGDTDALANADQRWRENAEQIASLLASMNEYWSVDDWSAMLFEHLNLLTDFVTAVLTQNYQDAVKLIDDIEMQVLDMADMMSMGIARQFPD